MPNLPFPDLLKAVEEKFRQSADFFKNAKMAVSFQRKDTFHQRRGAVNTGYYADDKPRDYLYHRS